MDESDFIRNSRIAICGLGLTGGSLSMALRGKCAALLGIDPDPATLALAQRLDLVDQCSTDPAALLPQADVIILAAPVQAIIQLIRQLPQYHPGEAVVMDVGSTKRAILSAMETLPARFDPIGGHPMCGKELSSLTNAEATLFQGATFALVPSSRSSEHARALAEQLVHTIGAHPLWLDATTHDRWTAATSHLPYLLANALAAATPPEAAPLVSTGFRSTARLAKSSITMMMDILATNADFVLQALQRYRANLSLLEENLKDERFSTLETLLQAGATNCHTLTDPPPTE